MLYETGNIEDMPQRSNLNEIDDLNSGMIKLIKWIWL